MSVTSPHESRFTVQRSGDSLTLSILRESFDAALTDEFRSWLDEIWDSSVRDVTIDFRQVRFIDSSGIGALLGLHKRLRGRKEPLLLVNAQPSVVCVIELLRLQRVFTIQPSGA